MTLATLTTDGACVNNPGPGGWSYIARHDTAVIELSDCVPDTTNNRMELMAAIEGLKALDAFDVSCEVLLISDSQYLIKGLNLWRIKWALQGWMRGKPGNKVPIPNTDLWQQLDELARKHTIVCKWVRGHTGNIDNERCDRLAEDAAEALADELGTVRRRPRRASGMELHAKTADCRTE